MNRLLCFTMAVMFTIATHGAFAQELRGRLLATPIDTELRVTLKTGEALVGYLADVGDTSFVLRVLLDEETRHRLGFSTGKASTKRTIIFDQVQDLSDAGLTPTEELRHWIRVGHTAKVTLPSGETVRGDVDAFDGNVLTLEGRTWRLSNGDVTVLEARVSDSLLNGALIGAGIGAGLSALGLSRCDCTSEEAFSFAVLLVGMSTGLGILFDAMTTHTKVFRFGKAASDNHVRMLPIVSRDRLGLLVELRF